MIERLNVAQILMDCVGIDFHDVEVILWMQDSTLRMRSQLDKRLEDLAGKVLRIIPQQKE